MPGTVWDPPYEAPPEGEPDEERQYLDVNLPQASVTDGSTEEVEVATGLDLGPNRDDNFGMRVLGLQVLNPDHLLNQAQLNASDTADAQQRLDLRMQTRSGAFDLTDPEVVYEYVAEGMTKSDGTNQVYAHTDYSAAGLGRNGDVIVTPQLIFELENNVGTTINADELQARLAYTYVPLDDDLFRELLEKHADLFLA